MGITTLLASTSVDNAVALAAIGLAGTIAAGMFSLLKSNTKAQNGTTQALERLVAETAKGNREAKQRNGHLGEQNERITELVLEHSKEAQGLVDLAASKVAATMAVAMKSLKNQHVDNLHVQQSNIENETVENETVNDKRDK